MVQPAGRPLKRVSRPVFCCAGEVVGEYDKVVTRVVVIFSRDSGTVRIMDLYRTGNTPLGRKKQAAIEMVGRNHRRMGKQMVRTFTGKFFNALVLVLVLTMAVPWVAFADTVTLDGDIATAGDGNSSFNLCAGQGGSVTVGVNLKWNGNQHYANKEAVTVTASLLDAQDQPSATGKGSTFITAASGSITPTEWDGTADGSTYDTSSTDAAQANLSLSLASDWKSKMATDVGPYKVRYTLSGTDSKGTAYTIRADNNVQISEKTTDCNSAPVATAQDVSTNEDVAKLITLAGTDADGNALTFKVTSLPSNGKLYNGDSTAAADEITATPYSLGANATQVTYKPNADYNNTAETKDSFAFKANDGTVDSVAAAVSITVNAVNDAPSFAKGANQAVDEDAGAQSVAGWATRISKGPENESGQSLLGFTVTGNSNSGLFSAGPAVALNGTLTYTPAANASGSATIKLVLKDDGGTANGGADTSAEESFTITVNAVNDAPVAFDDSASGTEDTTSYINVLANDSDVDGDTLRVSDISIDAANDAKADVSIVRAGDADAQGNVGKVRFVPAENFNGSVAFGYTASDGSLTDTANVTVDVASVNDLPTATVELSPASPRTNQTLTATVTRSDVDGDAVSLRYVWKNGTMVVRDVTKSAGTSADLTDSLDLSVAGNGDKGDKITVEVTPNDGTANGAAASDFETVADTTPEAGTASISPSPAYRGSTLTAEGENTWSDADGDTISYTYQWYKYNPETEEFQAISGATGETYSGTLTKSEQYQVRITGTADGASASDTSDALMISNSAPVADAGADITNASEGASVSFDGSGSGDIDGDALEYSWNFGDGSVTTVFSTSATASHTYADGPNQYTVTLTVRDGDGGTHTDTLTIAVNNVAPTASFSAPDVNEGSNISLSLSGADDASSADKAAGFSYSFDCGSGYGAWGAGNSASCTTNDNGSRTVKGQIKDKDGGVREYTASVTVNNVAPTTTNAVFTFNPVTREAKASFDFSDVGTADTHTASFAWSVNGTTTVRPGAVVQTNGAGTASDTLVLPVGCYTLTVIGTVADDDGASTEQSIVSDRKADAYKASFKAPIMDNARNIVKYGNVVPVKVVLESQCAPGTTVTDQSLYITLAKGVNGEYIEDTNTVAESASAADSGSQMRTADGMYIYNLSTKNLTANADYAVRIRQGSTSGPIILQAVIYPKK